MTEGPIVFWSTSDADESLSHEDIQSCVSALVDDYFPDQPPETITVYGYARMIVEEPGYAEEAALENLLEVLDEEYGGDDATDATEPMKAAAKEFVAAVVKEYQEICWACEIVERREVRVADYVEKEKP